MDENRRNHYKSLLIVFLIFAILFYIIATLPPFSTHTKYANDYILLDMIKAQRIVLDYDVPTEEMIKKYDINEDAEITATDVKIIQQMILGYYDAYEIRNDNKKVIKYIND